MTLFAILLQFSSLFSFFNYNHQQALSYIERHKALAIKEMERTGIPASIKLAQALVESQAGTSDLALRSNNHFGIKCGAGWRGGTYYSWDDDPQMSCFRVYSSIRESYIAHSNFLSNPDKNSRYGFLFRLNKKDYRAWAHGLQTAGYATDPSYAQRLIQTIERYELYRFDRVINNNIAGSTRVKTSPPPAQRPKVVPQVIHVPKISSRT
jgi:flagellum-specific peptidoglycan hydrolase FlgJ